jgi:membrane protein implicated in regulation of membrane protease activity
LGLIAPPASAGTIARVRGILLIITLIIVIIAIGVGLVELVGVATGGISFDLAIFWGILLVLVVLGVLAFFGRRKQKRAQAERSEQIAARTR